MLAQLGLAEPPASLALSGAAGLDIAVGIATWLRWRFQWVALLQIGLMVGYSLLVSLGFERTVVAAL